MPKRETYDGFLAVELAEFALANMFGSHREQRKQDRRDYRAPAAWTSHAVCGACDTLAAMTDEDRPPDRS